MVGIDVAAADRTLSAAVGHGVAFRDRTGHIGTGKLIKIVAVALSDEHIFSLEGGRANKTGQPVRGAGGYGLNPKGQPHSTMIATETVSLIIDTGEPGEARSMRVIDIAAAS
jgi:hypothetical protein